MKGKKLISSETNIYKICLFIPKGKVATYGQLAQLAGKPKSARAVGVFMKNNPDALPNPLSPRRRLRRKTDWILRRWWN